MRGPLVCLPTVHAVGSSPATALAAPCRALRGCRPMTLLGEVVGLLSADAIPHALIGAAALAVRGIARSTFDIDLLTTDRRVFEPERWAPLVRAGATVDIRHGDAEDPLTGVIRITSAGTRPVDRELRTLPAAMRAAWSTARS